MTAIPPTQSKSMRSRGRAEWHRWGEVRLDRRGCTQQQGLDNCPTCSFFLSLDASRSTKRIEAGDQGHTRRSREPFTTPSIQSKYKSGIFDLLHITVDPRSCPIIRSLAIRSLASSPFTRLSHFSIPRLQIAFSLQYRQTIGP